MMMDAGLNRGTGIGTSASMGTNMSGDTDTRNAIQIELRAGELVDQAVDALIVPVAAGRELDPAGEAIDSRLEGALARALADAGFSGNAGKSFVVPTLGLLPARRIVTTGTGSDGNRTTEDIRRAWSAAARASRDAGARVVASAPPPVDVGVEAAFRAAVEGLRLGTYDFARYRTLDGPSRRLERFTFVGYGDDAERGIDIGRRVAEGVCLARDLVNQPANALYPVEFARIAREVAERRGLECVVHDRAALETMGAGAILAVGQGSAREPRLIHLTYRPRGTSRGSVAFVGKAITFDTGGINLKPTGPGLERMKIDMAGGAAVLGAMSAVAALDVPFTVHGVISSAENMISGSSFRPGDVLKALNGKTIEVVSTDAEGRLVLADALTYIARAGAEVMIDLATLTGSAVVALGSQCAAVFGTDQRLVDQILAAGHESGEMLWPLPLIDEYREMIRGDVADIKNSGGRPAGAITAALFIREFVEGVPWAHLDIAGTAYSERAAEYTSKGGTGFGVRTLLTYLEDRARTLTR